MLERDPNLTLSNNKEISHMICRVFIEKYPEYLLKNIQEILQGRDSYVVVNQLSQQGSYASGSG